LQTYCVDRQVPDSSCTATALFTGVNGPYYTVGLDSHGKTSDCEVTRANKDFFPTSIMSHAQRAGKKTGQ
jgi:alkaline phosphatase